MQVSVWVDLNSEPKSMEASGCPEGRENKLKNLKGMAVENGWQKCKIYKSLVHTGMVHDVMHNYLATVHP